jgi:predicted CopG family antitoxin
MLDDVMRNHPVDPRRVILTGLSMGGYGAWDLAARRPDLWAAVVPICGGGDPGTAAHMKDLPIWAFQGAKDPVVPPERSREMVEAVRRAGGKPRYTEYPDVAHDSWTPAYRDRISSRGSSRRGSRVAHEGRAPGRLRPRAFARAARLRPSDGREGMRNPRFPRGKILGVISRCSTSSLEVASLTSGFFVASCLCTMHDTRMSTKTISLKLEAYERLRRARRHPAESFSEVILRAVWPGQTLTGAELLELIRKRGPSFGEAGLARIEAAKRGDRPPEDKWGAD